MLDELHDVLRAHDTVASLFAARDEEHENAVAPRMFLEPGA